MHKYTTALRLPRLEEPNSQKSPSYYNAPKNMLPSLSGPIKTHPRAQKLVPTTDLHLDHSFSDTKKGFSPDKGTGAFFGNSSLRQDWILKNIEAQREILEGKPQYYSPYDNQQAERPRQNTKVVSPDRVHESMNPKFRDSPDPLDGESTPKAVNLSTLKYGRTGRFSNDVINSFDGATNKKKKTGLELDNGSEMFSGTIQNRGEMSVGAKSTASKYGQIRFPSLNPVDESRYDSEDKGNKKVNVELILSIDDKLRAVYENPDNRQSVIARLKEYLELVDNEEPIHVEGLFFDTRARRNLKAYLMLEKTSVYTLLFLFSEETHIKEALQTNMRNICHYMYSNFVNFTETVATKLELLPRFSQLPNLEKLKQIGKRRPQEIDRSFSIEQISKLLLRVLRTSLKQTTKKNERSTKVDLLLEKIEFGLMANYNNELKSIFRDLILRHKINIVTNTTQAGGFGATGGDRFGKPEKKPLGSTNSRLTALNSQLKSGTAQKEALLPPPVPKPGQEGRPIYTLVLDMDETLIHFEEVGGRGRFFVRPYADKFLKEMSELYEVVIFTAGAQDYADKVLNILDPNGYIDHRLYRQHVTLNHSTPGVLKDLARIGRDLTKTLIVDNVPENFRLQPDNGIEIISWYNNPYDTELLTLTPFLTELVMNNVEDVSQAIRKYNKKEKRKAKHY